MAAIRVILFPLPHPSRGGQLTPVFGHANDQISGFRNYPWTHGGFEQVLNNNYYKHMSQPGMYRVLKRRLVGKMQYCKLNVSTFIGDEYGNAITTSWLVRSQFQHNDGGAWNWFCNFSFDFGWIGTHLEGDVIPEYVTDCPILRW